MRDTAQKQALDFKIYMNGADVKVLYQGTLAECEQFMDDLDEPYIGNTYLLGGE